MIFLAVQLATKIYSIKCTANRKDLLNKNLETTNFVYDAGQPLESTFPALNNNDLLQNDNLCTDQTKNSFLKTNKIFFDLESTNIILSKQENLHEKSLLDDIYLTYVSENYNKSKVDKIQSQNVGEQIYIPFESHRHGVANDSIPTFVSEKEFKEANLELYVSKNISDPKIQHGADLKENDNKEYAQLNELLLDYNGFNIFKSIEDINQPKDFDPYSNISEINEWIFEQPEFSLYNANRNFIDTKYIDNPLNPITDFDFSDRFLSYQKPDSHIYDYKGISKKINTYEPDKKNIKNPDNQIYDYQATNTDHYYGPTYPELYKNIEPTSNGHFNNEKYNASIIFNTEAISNMQKSILKNQIEIENERINMDTNKPDATDSKVYPSCVNLRPLTISSEYTKQAKENGVKFDCDATTIADDVFEPEELQSENTAKSKIMFSTTDGNLKSFKIIDRDKSRNKNSTNIVSKYNKNLITILEDIKLPKYKSFGESINQALGHIGSIKTSSAINKQNTNTYFTINANNSGFEESNNDICLLIEVGKNKPDANSNGLELTSNINYNNNGDTYTKNDDIVFSLQKEAHANFSDFSNKNIKNAKKLMNKVHIDTNNVANTSKLIKKPKKSLPYLKKRKINYISNYKNKKNDTGNIKFVDNEKLINACKKSTNSNNEHQIDVTNNINIQNCNVKIAENTSKDETNLEIWDIQFDYIQKNFGNDRTLLHHRKILVDMKHFAYNFPDKNGIIGLKFNNFLYTNIDALISSTLYFDEDYIEVFNNYEIKNVNFDNNVSKDEIDNINNELYKALGELSENEKKFHAKLTEFVQNKYFNTDFTFNNLLFIICKNACNHHHIQIYQFKMSVIQTTIIKILQSSSFETFIYYGEMSNLIDYFETLIVSRIKIKNIGNYYAFLNVLSVVVKFKWFYKPIEQKTYNLSISYHHDRLNNLLENEKHRQNFYKILLYVIRPFVSQTKYLQAWHKNVTQGLDFKFITSRSKYQYANHYRRFKLSFYPFLDILLWKGDFYTDFFSQTCSHDLKDFYFFEFMLKQKNQKEFKKKLSSVAFQVKIIQYLNIIQNKNEVMFSSLTNDPFLFENFYLPLINILHSFQIPKFASFEKAKTTVDVRNTIYLYTLIPSLEKLLNLFSYKTILFNFVDSKSNI